MTNFTPILDVSEI